jgi:hypothetical protein
VLGIGILVVGLVGAIAALKRAERWAARQKHQAETAGVVERSSNAPADTAPMEDPQAQNGFVVSAVALEKAPGTSLVYAIGTVKNTSDHKRFGVKVELDLLDADNQKAGTATDYQQVMETNSVWRFKALAVDPKATTAKVVAIKEDQ